MNPSQDSHKGKLTILGYTISIAGMLLAAFLYLFLDISEFFYGLNGILGLSGASWRILGGVIWIFIIMALLVPVILKVGVKR
jgi:hypothetical protein